MMFGLFSSSPRVPDALWNQGSPMRRRLSKFRRYSMMILLLLFCAIIGAYTVVTDSSRVRAAAEDYLSRITGGDVKVGKATLSIFEGLRLDRVTVTVPNSGKTEPPLFSAESFQIRPNLTKLVRGEIEAASILAIGPSVQLIEDVDARQWNYDRLERRTPTTGPSKERREFPKLPEIRLRNARVEYGRVQQGKLKRTGTMAIEGQLIPDDSQKSYGFSLQSRGGSDLMGPRVEGQIDLTTQRVRATLRNVEFGADMRAMLPQQVQRWWQQHELAGRVDVPILDSSIKDGGDFRAGVELNGVTMIIRPEETQSSDEIWRRAAINEMIAMSRALGADSGGWLTTAGESIRPSPVVLREARGSFVFTNKGIEFSEVVGWVEGIAVRFDGKVDGYSADAPAQMRVTSLPTENIVIPVNPGWINILPPAARETYDHMRPRGTAKLELLLRRPSAGARVEVEGAIEIVEGGFTFDRFPYPIDRASGRITLGPDSKTGKDALKLIGLKGYGAAGGPNEESPVSIEGIIAPLSSDPGVDITIRGTAISSEPLLMQSFPPITRRALRSLDAPNRGDWPKFTANVVCNVFRPEGPRTPWSTEVDVEILNAEGAPEAFPYHLSGVTGKLEVRRDHVNIIGATMKRDGATVTIDGKVSWHEDDSPGPKPQPGESTVRTELRINAVNAPIDENLLSALPPTYRAWMERLGVQGRFDLSGDILPNQKKSKPTDPSTTFAFDVKLSDATIWPKDGTFSINSVAAELALEPEKLTLKRFTAKRGEAEIAGAGTVEWPNNQPRLDMTATAERLDLDAALYNLLPDAGRAGWDAVKPTGTVDAKIAFKGALDADTPLFEITLRPRELSVLPDAFPCTFTNVAGSVSINRKRVTLNQMTARRGEAKVALSGVGNLPTGVWDFTVDADDVTLDKEIIAALPPTLSELATQSSLSGKYNVEFTRLRLSRSSAATQPGDSNDVDFAVRLETKNGALEAGVPIREINGAFEFEGASAAGELGALKGKIDVPRFLLGSQEISQVTATLSKQPASPIVHLTDIRSIIAGGEVAGQVDWAWPDDGPARYAMSLVVRDADVTKLVADAAPQLRGSLTASLAVEGAWNDPTSRRGRGDVMVEGKEMYRIPLLLGLLQITNLSLPINSPFERAFARYGLDGNRVTFEAIELSAEQMSMRGDGFLDFGDKKVQLNFVTDAKSWLKVPILDDFLRGARNELLQIRVRGTLSDPKVSAGALPTISTTIDEVFRGDGVNDNEAAKVKR